MVESYSRREWMAVAACAVGISLGITTVILGTFPFFLQPVCAELRWSRTFFSGVIGVCGILSAIAVPFLGRGMDRWGVRKFVLPGVVLLGLNVMALSRMTGSPLTLVVLFATLGITGQMCGLVPLTKVIASIFHERRGLMIALIIGGDQTIASAVAAPLTRFLIVSYGWRRSYLLLGIAILVIAFPVLYFFLHEADRKALQPAPGRLGSASAGMPGKSAREAVATNAFWLLMAMAVLIGIASQGFMAHSYAWLTERGISAAVATTVLALIPLSRFLNNTAGGFLLDRFATPKVTVPFVLVGLSGLLLMESSTGGLAVIAAALIFGASGGMMQYPYLVSRYFGLRSFSELYGYFTAAITIAVSVGPVLMGMCFDRFGSYTVGIRAYEGVLLLSTALIALLGPYVYAARR
jgi:predicted MFS family arabinose efflux permease